MVLKLANGGQVCVRQASGGRWEFRYSPKGNTQGKWILIFSVLFAIADGGRCELPSCWIGSGVSVGRTAGGSQLSGSKEESKLVGKTHSDEGKLGTI
jgi:hypothetical protein